MVTVGWFDVVELPWRCFHLVGSDVAKSVPTCFAFDDPFTGI